MRPGAQGPGAGPERASAVAVRPSPSREPSRAGPPPTTPRRDAPARTGFSNLVAVACNGKPTGEQVLALLRRASCCGAGAGRRVTSGPLCAGTWQYTVVDRVRRGADPRGHPGRAEALTLVTAGTNPCTAKVRGRGPAGHPSRAAVRCLILGRMPGVPPTRFVYLGPEGTFAEQALLTHPRGRAGHPHPGPQRARGARRGARRRRRRGPGAAGELDRRRGRRHAGRAGHRRAADDHPRRRAAGAVRARRRAGPHAGRHRRGGRAPAGVRAVPALAARPRARRDRGRRALQRRRRGGGGRRRVPGGDLRADRGRPAAGSPCWPRTSPTTPTR